MKKVDSFPAADGHIESILIGAWKVKVSFQTWDRRQLVLIYSDVKNVISFNSIYHDFVRFSAHITQKSKMQGVLLIIL